jgi:hypothetical protein
MSPEDLEQISAVFEVGASFADQLAALALKPGTARRAPLLVRFLAKVEICADGHWRWRGATAGGNQRWDFGGPYGQMKVDGKNVYAHRMSLMLAGRPCPGPGYVPHHWCRVRLCVRPDYPHLEWLTREENTRLSNDCSGTTPF